MNKDDQALFYIAISAVGLGAVIVLHNLRENLREKMTDTDQYLKAINTLKAAINIARPHLVPSRRAEVDFYVEEADKTLEGL